MGILSDLPYIPVATTTSKKALILNQEKLAVPTEPPSSLKRVAGGGLTWGLPRTFSGYRAVVDTAIGGKATKWILRNEESPNDFYIAKFGNKNGRIEVYTELFNNQLGTALGFEMAHSGLARLDKDVYFVTRNFREENERLVHGSLMVEEVFAAPKATEKIEYNQEQAFYTIDVVYQVIRDFCGAQSAAVFLGFVEMLVFDALIGSMDRHAQNWGVLQTATAPQRFRFSPVFDSARALFWDIPDGRLLSFDYDEEALTEDETALRKAQQPLRKYVENSKPCIGPEPNHPKMNKCNHFDLVRNLMKLYPTETNQALAKLPSDVGAKAATILGGFPFADAFWSVRKRMIIRTLSMRGALLHEILNEGGGHAINP